MHGRCYKSECGTNAETGALELRLIFTDSSDYEELSDYAVCPYQGPPPHPLVLCLFTDAEVENMVAQIFCFPPEGGTINPRASVSALSNGVIECPPYEEVCFGTCPFQCNGHGNCIPDPSGNGGDVCVCYPEYTGVYCQTNACPGRFLVCDYSYFM